MLMWSTYYPNVRFLYIAISTPVWAHVKKYATCILYYALYNDMYVDVLW